MDSRGNVAEDKNVSSKAIRKKVNNTVSIALKRYKIDSYILLDLDKVLNDVYCSFRPVSADYDTRKELVKNLNAMAIDIYGNSEESSPVLEAYGSFVMDMYSSQSDLDVSINFGNGTPELPREKKLEILKRFAKKLRSLQGEGHVKNVESIFSAKVPIVKFSDQGTGVECDLSVENKDGILNSQIVRIISQIDGRFQKLCMLVKHWAKAHEVNSALHRTLNSVSITLLVALHLQTQNPPILPPFSMLFKDGIDPPNVEKRAQKFLNWGQRNQESLGRLFATFFIKLQSVEFLWRQGLCVSVLNGLWISKKWKKVGVGSISVEDFTNVSQNVARRVNGAGAKKIYSSINRTVEDIFEFLNDKVAGTDLRHRLFGKGAVVQIPPGAPLNGKTAGIHRVSGQQAVVEPRPPVQPLNGKIAGTHRKQKVFARQPVVEPRLPVPPLNGKIAGTHRKQKVFAQQPVVEPRPPMPPLNGNIAGTHFRHKSFGQQAVVQPPPVRPLNGNIAGIHFRDMLFDQQVLVESHPLLPPFNGNITGTHFRHRSFDQPAVLEPRPPVPSLNIYSQQLHNNYRNGFSGPPEEHYSKRVCLGNNYRAVEETGQWREEERYEDPRGKRNRYIGNFNGFEEFREIPRFGIHSNPLDDPYRQVPLNARIHSNLLDDPYRQVPLNAGTNGHLVRHRHDGRYSREEPMHVGPWQDYNRRIDPPPPQPLPPYGRVSYENFRPQNLNQPHFGRSFY
ncbi:unnamed protein product [Arabidopsis lyrata]|uniref:uncharacterized protein LOC9311815 isoform X1 n=2 Tax=Arabidopsis lyrata subsp. lyrata TaxID=81972 RepID=UPI000A29CF35|nr:uncharacterized protein LOC9311815 isoform X1 [Arabidopsis lyrata subsp. lyrata]CAH8267550.1 unnamed protein product [Arabidopsis lyrata]|eukprot:XP_020880433.1 uncharacterized protein LOC9311815 isoform X1 [Arabidopsis lyrata subsp. lyrata]